MLYNVDNQKGTGPGRSHAAPEPSAVELRGVTKAFGAHRVLRGVDLVLAPGRVLGLLGPNGAGKTTLVRIMAGLARPDAGTVRVAGVDATRAPAALGARIGIAPQDLGIYPRLTARQNLVCFGEIAGLRPRAARRRADELLAELDLSPQARQIAGRLSGGQKRRLHTAVALVARPRVAFLDEPTVGADVTSRGRILDAVSRLCASGTAVVYTTHYLPELGRLGGEVAILRDGRIAAAGTIPEIVERYARGSVRVAFAGAAPAVPGWRRAGATLTPDAPPTSPGTALAALLATPGADANRIREVSVRPATLETAYLAVVEPGSADARPVEAADVAVA